MAFKTEAEEEAETFVEKIKGLVRSEEGLIYRIESNVNDPNVLSPSTIGDKDVWVEVTLFNVSDPDDLFDAYTWVHVGEVGADVDMTGGSHRNGYNPTVEFHNRFSG